MSRFTVKVGIGVISILLSVSILLLFIAQSKGGLARWVIEPSINRAIKQLSTEEKSDITPTNKSNAEVP